MVVSKGFSHARSFGLPTSNLVPFLQTLRFVIYMSPSSIRNGKQACNLCNGGLCGVKVGLVVCWWVGVPGCEGERGAGKGGYVFCFWNKQIRFWSG